MSSEDDQIQKNDICSKCERTMNFSDHSWPVELICDHKICLKCIMADYPQETDQVIC